MLACYLEIYWLHFIKPVNSTKGDGYFVLHNLYYLHLRRRENMGFCPIDPDGNFSTRGAEFLEQPAVSADPQVLLRYFHLKQQIKA